MYDAFGSSKAKRNWASIRYRWSSPRHDRRVAGEAEFRSAPGCGRKVRLPHLASGPATVMRAGVAERDGCRRMGENGHAMRAVLRLLAAFCDLVLV